MNRIPTRRCGRQPLARLVKAYGGIRTGCLDNPLQELKRILAMGPGGDDGRPHPRMQQKFWPGIVPSAITATSWVSWSIPRNASMVKIVCQGAGAAGSGAFLAASGTTGGGGGGGGSGATAALIIPARWLPATLFLLIGVGGVGTSVSATAGGGGALSVVSDQPGILTLQDIVLTSGSVAATSSVTQATTSNGATAGVAETVATLTGQLWSGLGVWSAVAGQAGAAGGSSAAAGGSVTWGGAGLLVSGGAGGAGKTVNTGHAGGNITGAGKIPTLTGGAASTNTAAGNGTGGFQSSLRPYLGTGGAGGGSAGTTGTGGGGGQGGWGSGGGGNGSGPSALASGNGGPGFIIISWW
jgi:hypothetical protein